jgi:anti-sigma factor RsiW
MPQECRQLEETFLHAYVDGEFGAEENAEVKAHLSSCPACTHAVRIHQSYKAAMSRAQHSAPHRLHDSLRERLHDEAGESRWTQAFRDPRGIALTAAAIGAAAWFLAGGLSHNPLQTRQSINLVDYGAEMHARAGALPLDYAASDVGSLQQWLSSKLDFGVRVPRFAQRAQVQGVRLSSIDRRPAAIVRYAVTADGRRVSLLIVDDPDPQLGGAARHIDDRDVYVGRARGFNVVSWRRDDVVYSLISDLDERDVLQLVQSAEQR